MARSLCNAICIVAVFLYVVAKFVISVPDGVLRFDYLVDIVAIACRGLVASLITPHLIVFFKGRVVTKHATKFAIQVARVAVAVEQLTQQVRNIVHATV